MHLEMVHFGAFSVAKEAAVTGDMSPVPPACKIFLRSLTGFNHNTILCKSMNSCSCLSSTTLKPGFHYPS